MNALVIIYNCGGRRKAYFNIKNTEKIERFKKIFERRIIEIYTEYVEKGQHYLN